MSVPMWLNQTALEFESSERQAIMDKERETGAAVVDIPEALHAVSRREQESGSFEDDTAKPLHSVSELLSWQPTATSSRGTVRLQQPLGKGTPERKSRTLVCHDMAGGYLDDRFVHGSHNAEAYRFYHWILIDTFVYFSHHFITIPPPCWINSAHRHGVTVLGTLITEWKEGEAMCQEMFSSSDSLSRVAERMVDIAVFYGFDGWLINIENTISKFHVSNVILFVKELTKKMHAVNPRALVVWYDSVTTEGQLAWQNELNALNSPFFDACDGIFLNYTWKEQNLQASTTFAGSRQSDVYVGVDVFGRGMIGGGGFDTCKATAIIEMNKLSVAIFAPGWVYENLGKENFDVNERQFWSLLKSHLTFGVLNQLPLSTSFCLGRGYKFFVNGEDASVGPWSNLSLQQLQPLPTGLGLACSDNGTDGLPTVDYYAIDAYNGGCCLQLKGRVSDMVANDEKGVLLWQLLRTDLRSSDSIYVSFIHKDYSDSDVQICLCLQVKAVNVTNQIRNQSQALSHVYLTKGRLPGSLLGCSNDITEVIQPLPVEEIPAALRQAAPNQGKSWGQSVYHVSEAQLDQLSIHGLLLAAFADHGCHVNILVGQLQIIPTRHSTLSNRLSCRLTQYKQSAMHVTRAADSRLQASVILNWDCGPAVAADVDVFCYRVWLLGDTAAVGQSCTKADVKGQFLLLGCTPATQYTVQLELSAAADGAVGRQLHFTVQAVYASGISQRLADAMHIHVTV